MLFFTHPLCFLFSSFCKQRIQSGRLHLSLWNWFDLTRLNWKLDPPLSTTLVFYSSLCCPSTGLQGYLLVRLAPSRVLVAPLVRNQVSFGLVPFCIFWWCLSSLVLYIGLFPSRWLDRSALYFWITLLRINPLNEGVWPLLLRSLENLLRNKTFSFQSNSGEQFLRRLCPSSIRMDIFFCVEKADFAW